MTESDLTSITNVKFRAEIDRLRKGWLAVVAEKTFNLIPRLQPIAAEERVYPDNLPKDDVDEQ